MLRKSLVIPLRNVVPLVGRVRQCVELIQPTGRLLDIGCSTGWLGPVARARGVAEYVGLDLNVPYENAAPGVAFVQGSALRLPFEDAYFDAVCLFDVIEHLPRGTEVDALREARRVVRSKGTVYLSTPHASWIHTVLDPAWYLGHRHYRRSTVAAMVRDAEFQIGNLFVAGGILESLYYLQYLVYKHVLRRPTAPTRLWASLIERAHRRNHMLGMTIFMVATGDGRPN
jgi:SAM-dependent methyltransferase